MTSSIQVSEDNQRIAQWAMASEPARQEDETPGHYTLRIAAKALALVRSPIGDDVREAISIIDRECDRAESYQSASALAENIKIITAAAITAIGSQSIEPSDATKRMAKILGCDFVAKDEERHASYD